MWTGHLEQCDLKQTALHLSLGNVSCPIEKQRLTLNYIKHISDDILITPHPA
jgi:hypothetical protein